MVSMPALVPPTVVVRHSFLTAMDEFVAEGARRSQTADWIEENAPAWHDPELFSGFVESLHAQALEETARPAGFVPTTTLWWVDGADYLGRVAVRHRLNEFLLAVGGHIGYDVRPSRRREGHATAMLRATLPHARALGIDSALVTCDTDNTASIRVIEAAGGVFEDQRGIKLRFWVPTGS